MRNFSYTFFLAFVLAFAFVLPAHAATAKFNFKSPSDQLTNISGYAYAYRWDEDNEWWDYAGNAYTDDSGKIKIKDLSKGTYYFRIEGSGTYQIDAFNSMSVYFNGVYYGGDGDWDTKKEVVLKGGTFFNGGAVSPTVADLTVQSNYDSYYIPSDGGTQNIRFMLLNLKGQKIKWKYWLTGYTSYTDSTQGYNSANFPLTDELQKITIPKGYSELDYVRDIPASAPNGEYGSTNLYIGNNYYKPKARGGAGYRKLDPSEESSPVAATKEPLPGEYTEEKIPFKVSKEGKILSEIE